MEMLLVVALIKYFFIITQNQDMLSGPLLHHTLEEAFDPGSNDLILFFRNYLF